MYAAYVVAFPLLWGQASHAYQMRQVTRAHKARMVQFRHLLGPTVEENEVVKTAKGAQWKFWVWWVFAGLVYIGLVAGTIVAIDEVPARIIEGTPTTTTTIADG